MATSKTSASELFNRYIWLANTVYSAGKITYEEIARKWRNSSWNNDGSDLPIRTFHDHRHAVEELFDIDIECDKHDGFKYYIENSEDIERGNLRQWILNTMSVGNMLMESKSLNRRILLENIPSGEKYLTTMIDAMNKNLVVEISYKNFRSDNVYTFKIEPWCLKLWQQRWYVLGLSLDLDQLRVYALDRIVGCELTKIKFEIPEGFDAQTFFGDYYGIYVDPKVKLEQVRLWVEGTSREYLRSLPLHHSQKEIETGDDYCVFEYTIRPTGEFIGELVNLCQVSKVLSPKWISDEVRGRVENRFILGDEDESQEDPEK